MVRVLLLLFFFAVPAGAQFANIGFWQSGEVTDTLGPLAPTGVSLGSVPLNLTTSPTISYTAAVDQGPGTTASHQIRIIRVSGSLLIRDWTTHTSGSAATGLTLSGNTPYRVFVRGIDDSGNVGASTSGYTWITIPTNCGSSPSPGSACSGGAIFAGALSPGATSGSGTDLYMTTPGGCNDSPSPTCSGATDTVRKYWNGTSGGFVDIPALVNYTTTAGVGNGSSNRDTNYGSSNTSAIVVHASIDVDSAAEWCQDLVYGGYSDWYLPNRYELNMLYTNRASLSGIDVTGNSYWSSTERDGWESWRQRFHTGTQGTQTKFNNYLVRCVRRF